MSLKKIKKIYINLQITHQKLFNNEKKYTKSAHFLHPHYVFLKNKNIRINRKKNIETQAN